MSNLIDKCCILCLFEILEGQIQDLDRLLRELLREKKKAYNSSKSYKLKRLKWRKEGIPWNSEAYDSASIEFMRNGFVIFVMVS